jgi:signal transduction histidine kinase
VIACNRDGVWSDAGAVLKLTAEPYWWQTAWFRVVGPLSAFGLLGGGTLLGLRRRHRRQIERMELLQATERERTRIAQDLHDDLGAGLTQISLNTAMLQNPAVASEVAGGLLQEIDQRSRELVTALDEIVWAANPKNDTVASLARYLCQYAQSCLQSADIACRLEVAPNLPDAPMGAEQRHHLFLAFKEALHNTLRHSGANELGLEITADARTLSVSLTDNGRGFVPGPVPEGADGLGNMRARLQRLGGSCVVTSAQGHGTKVTFCLPFALNGA